MESRKDHVVAVETLAVTLQQLYASKWLKITYILTCSQLELSHRYIGGMQVICF